MLAAIRRFSLVGIILLANFFPTFAEEMFRPGAAQPQAELPAPRIVHQSGYIFAGTVQSIVPVSSRANRVATVQISFRVDEAIRGVRTGQTLIVREWAGLWTSGERYRAGEHVLLFLYPPSKLGLTSPVGGAMGRFAVGPKGRVILPPGRVAFLPKSRSLQDLKSAETDFTPRKLVRLMQSAESE